MTVADYLEKLAQDYHPWEVQLEVEGHRYNASELLRGLSLADSQREAALQTGTDGYFLLDGITLQKLFAVRWSPHREGWRHDPERGPRTHYFICNAALLASLCGTCSALASSHLYEYPPPDALVCKSCSRLLRLRSATLGSAPTQMV